MCCVVVYGIVSLTTTTYEYGEHVGVIRPRKWGSLLCFFECVDEKRVAVIAAGYNWDHDLYQKAQS